MYSFSYLEPVCCSMSSSSFFFFNFTILYWFCHISTWIRHRYTCVPHPEPSSLLPPCTIPLGRPSAPAPRIQYHASNLDWRFISYMILYMFQCHSPKLSHPPCPVLTVASWPAYRFLKRHVRWSGIPISFRIFQFIVIHTVKGFGIDCTFIWT